MKTIIITGILSLLVLIGCKSKEKEDLNFKDFNLELSSLDLDFSKPQTQAYSSDLARDSIVTEVSFAVFESDTTSVGEKDSKIRLFMLDFSDASKTVTARIIFNEKESDLASWKNGPVCKDPNCLRSIINEMIIKESSVSFAIRRDLNLKEAQLFYKNEVQ